MSDPCPFEDRCPAMHCVMCAEDAPKCPTYQAFLVASRAREISPLEYTIIDARIAEGQEGRILCATLRAKLGALRLAAHPPEKEEKQE